MNNNKFREDGTIETVVKNNFTVRYRRNGNLFESFYLKNNKFEGEYIQYLENNKIWNKQTFKNDKKHGLCIQYHVEDGKIITKENYINGVRDWIIEY